MISLHISHATSFSCSGFCRSGDLVSNNDHLAEALIALGMRAERELLEWIPVNSLFCAVWLDGSVHVKSSRFIHRYLFGVSVYASTHCSSPEAKSSSYRKLSWIFRSVLSPDIVVNAGHFNAQFEYLRETERHIRGRVPVPHDSIDTGDIHIQVCSHHRLFLANTNSHHDKRSRFTWRYSSSSQHRTQIDHILIDHWCCGSIEEC